MSTESQNWRTETDASDYFLHQKKTLQVADRRPVPRNAADLGLGPGLSASAVRLDNYNDLLGTFNGYYSSLVGAMWAPNATDDFVGYVISDAELGGRQVFTSLRDGTEYKRTFTRNPTDPEMISWSQWTGQRVLPSLVSNPYTAYQQTLVPSGALTVLTAPVPTLVGDPTVYQRAASGILILKQGVYTGTVNVDGGIANNGAGGIATTPATVHLDYPLLDVTTRESRMDAIPFKTVSFPFTFVATNGEQALSVRLAQSSGAARSYYWTLSITRMGDAV